MKPIASSFPDPIFETDHIWKEFCAVNSHLASSSVVPPAARPATHVWFASGPDAAPREQSPPTAPAQTGAHAASDEGPLKTAARPPNSQKAAHQYQLFAELFLAGAAAPCSAPTPALP